MCLTASDGTGPSLFAQVLPTSRVRRAAKDIIRMTDSVQAMQKHYEECLHDCQGRLEYAAERIRRSSARVILLNDCLTGVSSPPRKLLHLTPCNLNWWRKSMCAVCVPSS